MVSLALIVLGCLTTYDIVHGWAKDSLEKLSFDLRMKHLHSLYRVRAFHDEHLMTKEELKEKISEEISKV